MKSFQVNKVQEVKIREGQPQVASVSVARHILPVRVTKPISCFFEGVAEKQAALMRSATVRLQLLIREQTGQGTTEYAILVGVLVVIAIVAIVAFKGKIQELWSAISDGINSL